MALLVSRNEGMHSELSVLKGKSFVPRATDVFIVTYPKCGTTWVSAIAQYLRSSKNDFEEITEVVPWDTVAHDCGQDLNDEQVAEPRLFKSHYSWPEIAKGGKYVYVIRHPSDAFVSFYNFLPAYMHVEGLSIETFAEAIFAGLSKSGGIWKHYLDWFEAAQKYPENILILAFEDLKRDLKTEISRLQQFMNSPFDISVDDVYAKTTFDAMAANKKQFDDHFVFDRLRHQIGIPENQAHRATKVHKGTIGSRSAIPDSVNDLLEAQWNNIIGPSLNCKTYDDLLHIVHILHTKYHPSP